MRLLRATAVVVAAASRRRRSGAEAGERLAGARPRCRRAAILAAQADQYDQRRRIFRLAWTYDTPAPVPPPPARGGGARPGRGRTRRSTRSRRSATGAPAIPAPRQSAATPLVVDGVMYMGTMYNRVVALDADTGKEIWVKDVGNTPSTRGIAYWPGTNGIPPQIVFGTGDGSSLLISLNAKTGEFTPGFGQGGKVDLRQGVGEKFPRLRVALSSPPAIYKTSRDHRQSLAGSSKPRTLGRCACMGPADGQARLDVSHDSQAGRAEPRRLEERSVGRSRRSQRLGIHHR